MGTVLLQILDPDINQMTVYSQDAYSRLKEKGFGPNLFIDRIRIQPKYPDPKLRAPQN